MLRTIAELDNIRTAYRGTTSTTRIERTSKKGKRKKREEELLNNPTSARTVSETISSASAHRQSHAVVVAEAKLGKVVTGSPNAIRLARVVRIVETDRRLSQRVLESRHHSRCSRNGIERVAR